VEDRAIRLAWRTDGFAVLRQSRRYDAGGPDFSSDYGCARLRLTQRPGDYRVSVPDPVVKEIASAIHVRHIQTPIGATEPFTRSSRVAEVVAHMEQHKYDVTPVFRRGSDHTEAKSADPDGTLWKTDVKNLDPAAEIGSAVRPLASNVLIDSNASLIELLDHFRNEHIFMLVVGGRGLDGIVTPSDMNKQAGRTHLFMQVSALELALAEMVRTANRLDSELLEALPRTRSDRARSLLARKQDKDEAADLVAALDFQDLLYVVRARTTLDELSALSDEHIGGLSDFRNRVMHSVLDPAGDERDRLEHLLTHTALVAQLLESIDRVA
jgi:hypothetical protein